MANIGFHLSISGNNGFIKALNQAHDLEGISAIQIFTKSPRSWQKSRIDKSQINAFKKLRKKINLKTVIIHGIYLINFGGNEELRSKSLSNILDDINIAEQLEIEYVVFHPGSGSFSKIRDSLLRLMENIPQNVKVLIENTASNKNRVCSEFTSLKNLIDGTNIGLCLDTCHAFVAGYNLHQAATKIINDLDNIIGLNNIPIFHFNDAIGNFGSGLDRHASLLEGKIGDSLKYIFQDQRLKDKTFIVECPKEKYLYNLSILKNWINS